MWRFNRGISFMHIHKKKSNWTTRHISRYYWISPCLYHTMWRFNRGNSSAYTELKTNRLVVLLWDAWLIFSLWSVYIVLQVLHNLIIVKIKVLPPQASRWPLSILATLFRPSFGLLAPKTFNITWFSNLSTLSVPDEGYSRWALNLI